MYSKLFKFGILSVILSILCPVHAINTFLFPTSKSGQSFHNGDTLEIVWTANFTDPYLQLFCSYVQSPFLNTTILDGSKTFPLKLEIGPQPNCYLLLSQGVESFGTGIFAITPSNGTTYLWSQYGVAPATNGTATNQTIFGHPPVNGTISFRHRSIGTRRSRQRNPNLVRSLLRADHKGMN